MNKTWELSWAEFSKEILEAEMFRNAMCDIYPDDDTANKRLYRKRDRHKYKGKRRVHEGYGVKYV